MAATLIRKPPFVECSVRGGPVSQGGQHARGRQPQAIAQVKKRSAEPSDGRNSQFRCWHLASVYAVQRYVRFWVKTRSERHSIKTALLTPMRSPSSLSDLTG